MYNLHYVPTTLGYKVEEKLYLGVREQKRLNTTGLSHGTASIDTSQKIVFGFILYVLHANKHKMFWLQYQVTPAKSEVCTDTVPVCISLARARWRNGTRSSRRAVWVVAE
jgi:hypothetical protein